MALPSPKRAAIPAALGVCLVLLLNVALSATAAVAEKVYYRYVNEQGITVQTDRLPPEAVPRGYSIVTANGDVLQTVPRQLNARELKLRDARLEKERAAREEQYRIRKWEQSLVLRYSDVEEIDQAKKRALKEYDTRIGILQGNLMSLKGQIETEQSDAANYERRGNKIPETLRDRISSLKSEVLYAETSIDELQQERIDTEHQFEEDKARFQSLLEQSQARKASSEY
jgi:chromosome segregation ATPase